MTVNELFDTEHYRSIIILTDIFATERGLRQLHYRWALIPNHDNMKHALFIRAMKNFFNQYSNLNEKQGYPNKLERLYEEKILAKDCITSNSNLSNFLKKLSNQPYNILECIKEDEVPRYILTEYGKQQAKQWRLINLIKGADTTLTDKIYNAVWNVIEKQVELSITIQKKEDTPA